MDLRDVITRLEQAQPGRAAGQSAMPPWRRPGRLAYIVNHSFPFSTNGYAVRTHGLARALVEQGLSVVALTPPGRPWDLPGAAARTAAPLHDIDGVRYVHSRHPSRVGMGQADYLHASVDALLEALRAFRPGAVMAASNWENALPAAIAARELGLPFFYEVRGFWEITRASLEPAWGGSEDFRANVGMETTVALAADGVFTLNALMREELVRRGVPRQRIELVPNAYGALPDLSRPPRRSRAELGCRARYVVGYIGSFSEYEGLDQLVQGCARLRHTGVDVALLLVGSSNPLGQDESAARCPVAQSLRRLAQELGIADALFLPGRVGADALADYYAMLDVVVVPRRPLPVCELVSPIKPLEVAAFGKPLLASDVAPLQEMVDESGAGETFRAGDADVLAERLGRLLADETRRRCMGQAAREWVSSRRNWHATTATMLQQLRHRLGASGGR